MNYYNEWDKFAAQWLRELVTDGLIPEGQVDTRSIADIEPEDLTGFHQCHFFAGIGGWPRALELACIPADFPVWSGSCPCQPFSTAGKRAGAADDRNLWHIWFELIRVCRPNVVVGEQVASAIAVGWLDRVLDDLESEGYETWACVLPACSVGAPHIRARLFWMAVSGEYGCRPWRTERSGQVWQPALVDGSPDGGGMADAESLQPQGCIRKPWEGQPRGGCAGSRLGNVLREGLAAISTEQAGAHPADQEARFIASIPILCRDGKTRRIPAPQSGLQRLAHGLPEGMDLSWLESSFPLAGKVQGRVGLLKGYGNAIVPQVAAVFLRAAMEAIG